MTTIDFENRQKKAFIEALSTIPQEYSAARVAKVPIALVKGWYDSDPDFNMACNEVKEHLLDEVEAKAYGMALQGSERMIQFVLERQRENWNPRIQKEDEGPIKHRFFDFSGKAIHEDNEEEDPVDATFEEVMSNEADNE